MTDRQPQPPLPPQPAAAQLEPARGGNLRAEMLARMGHELRAPLNAVIGFIRLVEEGLFNTEAERRDFLASARQSALSMLDLINNILDLARIESGRLALQTVEFSVAELVEEVAKSLAPEAHAKGVEIDALVDPALPPRLKGDPVRLRQVFINLAGNAVKFTESGGVLLRVEQEQADPETCHLRVTVQDTGIGVPVELQATIFDSYVQSNQGLDRRGGGLGLGLAIVRQIVEQMGGRVGLESRPQQGSTFWFTVALPRGRYYSLRPRAPVPRLNGARLLLLDPRTDTAQVLLEKLSRLDVAVRHVTGLDDALSALARAHADGVPIRAVLVDHHLRPDDALMFARRVRRERTWFQPDLAHLTIVGATAAVGALRDAGFTAFLTKPVSVENLGTVLSTLLGRQGATGVANDGAAGETAPQRPQTPFARVLVAEDNPVNQRLLHALLSKQGYGTRLVSNGQEALAALGEPGGQPFDLVLMDVQMPVLDGLAATRAIRAQPAHACVPILALTSDALDGERERCLAAGMNDCLPKPIVPEVLQHKLSQWLNPPDIGASLPHEPLLDRAHLDSVHAYVRDTDPAQFTSWLALFRAEARTALDDIAQAGAARDAALLRAAARRLALASGGFGAPRLHALAERLAGGAVGDLSDNGAANHAELLAGLETTWLDLEAELDTRYSRPAP